MTEGENVETDGEVVAVLLGQTVAARRLGDVALFEGDIIVPPARGNLLDRFSAMIEGFGLGQNTVRPFGHGVQSGFWPEQLYPTS